MKAIRIIELDEIRDYPVDYILKSSGLDEMVGCCPKAFFNFFGLLGVIEGLNSEFLFWLKGELHEDQETLITPADGIKTFVRNEIFNKINYGAGFLLNERLDDLIFCLSNGWIMFSLLFPQGEYEPGHCEVYYIKNGRLFCDGIEISIQTFSQKIFCHGENRYILGKNNIEDKG